MHKTIILQYHNNNIDCQENRYAQDSAFKINLKLTNSWRVVQPTIEKIVMQFGVSEQIVYDLKRRNMSLLTFLASSDTSVLKQKVITKYQPTVNQTKLYYSLFNQKTSNGSIPTGSVCVTQAYIQMHLEWRDKLMHHQILTRFKQLQGIHEIAIQSEQLSNNENAAEKLKVKLKNLFPNKMFKC